MLYIDNPVGTGFSFTNSSQGLSVNEEQVAENLYKYNQTQILLALVFYSALIQFFTVFSQYQSSPFYVTGEVKIILYKSLIFFSLMQESTYLPLVIKFIPVILLLN